MLISAIFFVYFKMIYNSPLPAQIPQSAMPVKSFVEQCMLESATKGVQIAADQGGYIYLPAHIANNPAMYVSPDGLGIKKTPYWFYKGIFYVPTKSDVESQLKRYIEENIKDCISNFTAFKNTTLIEVKGVLSVDVSLNAEDVSFQMTYPLKVGPLKNTSSVQIDKFQTTLPVRLKKALDTATQVLRSEVAHAHLENFTIDLMASHPDIPFTDMVFSCSPLQWTIVEIKQLLQDMLRVNLPRIRVKNTAYLPFNQPESVYEKLLDYHIEDIYEGSLPKNVPADAYEYTHMFFDMGIYDKDPSVNVGFTLVGDDMNIMARPHDNGVLRSNMVSGNKKYLSFMCINIYHFVYDINYPVMVKIFDSESFYNDGFTFNFVMPVTIRQNNPYKQNYGYDLFETTYYDRSFCTDVGQGIVDIRAVDKNSGEELKDVNLSTKCIKFFCELGLTSADAGIYRLRTPLPQGCANPIIVAKKEGYLTTQMQHTDDDHMEFIMVPLKTLDLNVVTNKYNKNTEAIYEDETLDVDMNVSIQLQMNGLDYFFTASQYDSHTIELPVDDTTMDINMVLTRDNEFIGGYYGQYSYQEREIENADTFTLHAVRYVPEPFSKEDTLDMTRYLMGEEYQKDLAPQLK